MDDDTLLCSDGTVRYLGSWIILECDEDLARYYRRQLRQKGLAGPPYGSHITVLAGDYESPPKVEAWGKYEGQTVKFQYYPDIRNLGDFYWLPVRCEFLLDIREELGLNRNLKWPLHLTIAVEKDRK